MGNEEIKYTILVVDDSEIIRQKLKSFFNDYHIDVVTCSNGLEGIQKAVEIKPCLIFLDLLMPNIDGIKMLKVIKVLNDIKHIPVIVISANTDKRNVLAAIENGANKVITKPLHKDIIIKTVNDLMGSEFLKKSKFDFLLSENDNIEMRKHFIIMFLNSFENKEQELIDGVKHKNVGIVQTIIHEIKGAGGTIGYPKLTSLSTEVEMKLEYNDIDWTYVSLKCEQIRNLIYEISKIKNQ
jgi:CheY-like chemotaxis protein/HPt (histidine-containing phosphotransfer) domain-containing protein